MLLYFKVQNSRSFANEAELNMIAPEDYAGNGVIVNEKFQLKIFKTALIYGANASGKSNLLKALGDAVKIIKDNQGYSSKEENTEKEQRGLRHFPNKNSNLNLTKPTIYTFCLLINDRVFEYVFSNNEDRIMFESLSEKKDNEVVDYYKRIYTPNGYKYHSISSDFATNEDYLKAGTKEYNLLLSQAAHLSKGNDENTKFKNQVAELVQNYFTQNVGLSIIQTLPNPKNIFKALGVIEENEKIKEKVLKQLNNCKIPIVDIKFEKQANGETIVTSVHNANDENGKIISREYDFFQDESSGTVQFISWMVSWIISASKSSTIIIDEFGTNLHPKLSEFLLEVFQEYNAQLIFSSHDVKLMNSSLISPEQIWLIKNDKLNNSILYQMSDFDIDADKMRDNVYLDGLIDGIPQISQDND